MSSFSMDRLPVAGLLAFLLLLILSIEIGDATTGAPAEEYWKSALPNNTPMPASLSRLIRGRSSVNNGYDKSATKAQLRKACGIYNRYEKSATEEQMQRHHAAGVALFFLESDIQPGKKLTLHFMPAYVAGEKFLPRGEADAIPFSSDKIPEILSRFSLSPGSAEAAEVAETLRDCERPAAKGERKACATSLESMVDFAVSGLGTSHVRVTSTAVVAGGKEDSFQKQEYTVAGVKRASAAAGAQRLVVCHAEPYAYAVFSCHLARATRAYTVSVVGEDGTAAEAAAVCHTDTAGWNPKHLALQMLNVKPGTVPVCHFLPQNDVVWARS